MTYISVCGVGRYLPEKVVKNDYFVDVLGLDTSDEWILTRTGIKERRICSDGETTSVMAYRAALAAIKDADISVDDIGLIVVATSTPDYKGFPSVACQVQAALGLTSIPAFDISAACTGFNYALDVAKNTLLSSESSVALVIGADSLSSILDWKDRGTCILFGDGAGAVVIKKSEKAGILYSKLYANGNDTDILKVKEYILMDGSAVFKSAVSNVVPAIQECLNTLDMSVKDVDFMVPHQANIRIVDQMCKRLGLSSDRVVTNLDRYGNTSAASIPIALVDAKEKGLLKSGNNGMLVGFGAGFTWGVTVIKWE